MQLSDIPEHILEATFVNGLKPELRNTVRTMHPVGTRQAIKLALLIDENRTCDQVKVTTRPTAYRNSYARPLNITSSIRDTKNNISKLAPTPSKRLTDAEVADKRAKVLCFRCDGKFGPGHKCPSKTLQVMLIGEDEDEEEPEGEEHARLDMVSVSASSVMGLTTPHTIKLSGHIGGQDVVVLIGSRATHNFISLSLIPTLGLTIKDGCETGVMLGNGQFDKSFGICRRVMLTLPGY